MIAAAPPPALADLAALSARVGNDIRLVQGAGGNASIKVDGVLWVKASGTWLGEALERDVFVPLDLGDVRERLAGDAAEPLAGMTGPNGLRPSIETSLHALLPQAVVLHVHSVNAIAYAVRRDGREVLGEAMAGVRWAWVPYRRPGIPLTRAIEAALAECAEPPDVLLLANHGLVVAAPTVAEVATRLEQVEARLALPERAGSPSAAGYADWLRGEWRRPEDAAVHAIATDELALRFARSGALYPDHTVFLGAGWPEAGEGEGPDAVAERHEGRFGARPPFVVAPGIGVAVSKGITAGAERMLECLSLVTRRLRREDAVETLDDADIAALLDWDAEKYRQALARAT